MIHELICAGASLHSSDVDGLSTLLVAASVENNYTVDYLLDNGADVNFPLQFRSLLHVISIQVYTMRRGLGRRHTLTFTLGGLLSSLTVSGNCWYS